MKSPKESWGIFALGNSCSGRVAVLLCRGKRELLLRRRERGWQQPNPICEIGFDAIFKSSLKWRFSSQIQCRRIFSCYRRRRNKFERQKRRQFCYITMFENHFKNKVSLYMAREKSIFCIVGSFWRKNQNETFLLILNYCQRKDRKFLVVIISLMAEK